MRKCRRLTVFELLFFSFFFPHKKHEHLKKRGQTKSNRPQFTAPARTTVRHPGSRRRLLRLSDLWQWRRRGRRHVLLLARSLHLHFVRLQNLRYAPDGFTLDHPFHLLQVQRLVFDQGTCQLLNAAATSLRSIKRSRMEHQKISRKGEMKDYLPDEVPPPFP